MFASFTSRSDVFVTMGTKGLTGSNSERMEQNVHSDECDSRDRASTMCHLMSGNPTQSRSWLSERFYSLRYVGFSTLRKNAKPESSPTKARWITRAIYRS